VADYHRDTRALQRLTPPGVWVQLQRVDPLAEGSVSEFTLWFRPLPVRWTAVHSRVDRARGFTDAQRAGPLKFWRHTYSFTAEGTALTRVAEHIEYEHDSGLRSRGLFARPMLTSLFAYRRRATRRALER